MKSSRRDQNDISVLRIINAPLAKVPNVPFLKNDQFIVVVVMKNGGKRPPIVKGIPEGIGKLFRDDMVFPIHHLGIDFCLLLDVMRK